MGCWKNKRTLLYILKNMNYESETSRSKHLLEKYCVGIGMDVGYGGQKITESAWAFDMPQPYTNVGGDAQQLRGDCRRFDFICDNALDYIYSSHVLEDFRYNELIDIIKEWRRILKPNGFIVTNCPNQQVFLAHCAATGQGTNDAHKEQDFSLLNFNEKVLKFTGDWETVFEYDNFKPYSWLQVIKKINI
jgi:predicted SAM-dependent methyltransferase